MAREKLDDKVASDTRGAVAKAIQRALERGQIRRPKKCPQCKAVPGLDVKGSPMIEAVHFNGYSFEHRFDFKWMCVSCRSKAVWAKKKRSA